MNKEYAKKLLKKTTDDYNRIARAWSIKRWKLPSDILELTKYIKPGDNVLDLGCGNGYLYDPVIKKGGKYTGTDTSENQLKEAKQEHPQANFVLTEPLKLPFYNNEFDKVYCLSTIHHIPTKEFQLEFLNEIYRVLKEGGLLFLTAWNLSQEEHIHECKKIDNDGNILYPFKDSEGDVLAERFIHVFMLEELSQLIDSAGFQVKDAKVIKRGYGKFSNLLTIAKKI